MESPNDLRLECERGDAILKVEAIICVGVAICIANGGCTDETLKRLSSAKQVPGSPTPTASTEFVRTAVTPSPTVVPLAEQSPHPSSTGTESSSPSPSPSAATTPSPWTTYPPSTSFGGQFDANGSFLPSQVAYRLIGASTWSYSNISFGKSGRFSAVGLPSGRYQFVVGYILPSKRRIAVPGDPSFISGIYSDPINIPISDLANPQAVFDFKWDFPIFPTIGGKYSGAFSFQPRDNTGLTVYDFTVLGCDGFLPNSQDCVSYSSTVFKVDATSSTTIVWNKACTVTEYCSGGKAKPGKYAYIIHFHRASTQILGNSYWGTTFFIPFELE